MNVGLGFNCKTLLYHPYKSIQKQTNSWKFEESIIKNMIMSRFQNRNLFFWYALYGVGSYPFCILFLFVEIMSILMFWNIQKQ